MSIIKNEFELSVWEDRIGADDLFEEHKLVVIASDKMESSISAFDIKLTSNINGSNNLSFSIYGKYKTENGLEDNPFIPYLVNERKIKLKYKGKWYDFIIKNKDEESGNYRFNFTAIDLHINELSKNGFNLEFDQKLNNNQGSAIELAEKELENTDWQVVDNTPKPVGSKIYDDEGNEIRSNLITQEIKENLISYTVYNAPLRAKEIIYDEYLGTSISSVDTIFPIGTSIYVFYTCATQEGETVQFICNIDQKYTKDSERIITNGKYYLISSPTYEQIENNFANRIKSNGSVLNPGKVSDEYKGERYVISYKTKFDPLTQKYVTIYKDEQDKEVYVYQETQYITPSIIDNYVSNSKDYKNSSGWTGYNVTSARDIPKINDVTTPDIIKEYARRETSETTIYTPLLKNYIINADSVIVNSGINDNKVKIEGGAKIDLGAIAKGYVLEQIYKKFEFKSKQFLFNFGTSSIILGLSDAYNDFNVHYNNICFKAKNCAISTSSIDEQLLNINGNKHTHIINPFSGKNLCNYQTVIIKGNIDESAFLDALSTSFMLMDIEEIKQYINNKNLGVILINNDEIISNLIGYEGASNEIKTL